MNNSELGKKVPLYNLEELKLALKHKKRKKKKEYGLQPSLLSLSEEKEPLTGNCYWKDREGEIGRMHEIFQDKYDSGKEIYNEEIAHRRLKLREIIGLPIARGISKNVNNPFYKRLVKEVAKEDVFGIFQKYDRVLILSDIPQDLSDEIDTIKDFITGIIDEKSSPGVKYRKLNEFIKNFKK